MQNETPADRLREAATLVRQGHRRGAMVDRWGNRCAVGAILRLECGAILRQSIGRRLERDPIAGAAVRALAEHLPPVPMIAANLFLSKYERPHHRVTGWNDTFAKDGIEVAEFMEKIAAQLEEHA